MNIEDLQLITRTATANVLIGFFAKSKNISNEVIFRFFRANLLKKGHTINGDEFKKFFKELEDAGVGTHNTFNSEPAGRFVSKYELCDIAHQILNPQKFINLRPSTPEAAPSKEPVANKPKPKLKAVAPAPVPPPAITPLPIKVVKPAAPAPQQVIFMFSTLDGKHIPFPLHEVPRLVEQAEIIRSRM